MGRATGKSEGVGAPALIDVVQQMPRSAIGVVCRTFMQAADRTLPPLYVGWERMGYIRNVHYWVGICPPRELNIPRPLYGPDKEASKHCIFWFNGAYMSIISQDRPGSANGKTLDFLYGDEARFINKAKFDNEISKASRGNVKEFSHYAGHGGQLFLTDMPTTPEAKWILANQSHNDLKIKKNGKVYKMSDLMKLISCYQIEVNKAKYQLYTEQNLTRRNYLIRLIKSDEKILNYLRQETAMYMEASSLENAHFIGLKTLKKWKRDDLDVIFRTQVLNERLYIAEHGFYPDLNLNIHAYDKYDYSAIEGLWLPNGVAHGSLNDGDVDRKRPLDVAFDGGSTLNCMVVGQEHSDEYRIVKSLYVKGNKRLPELVDDFCKYYERHEKKEVTFYYDHTFVGTDATTIFSNADTIKTRFNNHHWKVNMVYIGQQPGHKTRFDLAGTLLKEDDQLERVKPLRFNRTNAASLLVSLQCAGALQGNDGVKKDKRPEKRSDVLQEEATHLTDAFDTLIIGHHQFKVGYQQPTTTAIFS
ncbi:terminase family protein [Pedobacter sp.]|uniref:terminase large subunit domain-containing protein n=1 Tax=Pedobacter sp. TaxID=1411316 RepID=UPI0031D149EE